MRLQGLLIGLATLAAAEAHAASIETVAPLDGVAPSVQTIGDSASIDPSIVAATPDQSGPFPSILALADQPAGDTPSVISLGDPAPAAEAAASTAAPQRQGSVSPQVIRGGEVGSAYVRPSAAASAALEQASEPVLDPNDKGTSAKRKALKRQAARQAEENATAAGQTDPSEEAVPLGQ